MTSEGKAASGGYSAQEPSPLTRFKIFINGCSVLLSLMLMMMLMLMLMLMLTPADELVTGSLLERASSSSLAIAPWGSQ